MIYVDEEVPEIAADITTACIDQVVQTTYPREFDSHNKRRCGGAGAGARRECQFRAIV